MRPPTGFGGVYAAIAGSLRANGVRIPLGSNIGRIVRTEEGFTIDSVPYDEVVSAVPIPYLAGYLGPDLAARFGYVDLVTLFSRSYGLEDGEEYFSEECIRKDGAAMDADRLRSDFEALGIGSAGRFLKLAGEDTTLILCTALGQQPCLKHEDTGGMHFYRPRDFAVIAGFAGIEDPFTLQSAMADEFHEKFASDLQAENTRERLAALIVAGGKVFRIKRRGTDLFLGCEVRKPVFPDTRLRSERAPGGIRFDEVFYRLDAVKNGVHSPRGIFWIHRPDRFGSRGEEEIDLIRVAPTLLDEMGLDIPREMEGRPVKFP